MSHPGPPDASVPASLEDALRSVAMLRGKSWAVTPLAGGITNRNFHLFADGESFVLRLAGEGTDLLGIDRRREHASAQAAAACGAGCEVVAFLPGHGAMLSRFAPGRALEPSDAGDPTVLARTVQALSRFHSAANVPGRFCPFRTVENYLSIARQRRVPLPPQVDAVLSRLAALEAELAPASAACPCHNDLLPANLIDDGQQVRLIDWEYAAMGDRFFDLGNLADNHGLSAAGEARLLTLYFGAARPDDLARLRAMRTVSALREATWGFVQAGVSTLDFDFLKYAERHWERVVHRLAANDATDNQPSRAEGEQRA